MGKQDPFTHPDEEGCHSQESKGRCRRQQSPQRATPLTSKHLVTCMAVSFPMSSSHMCRDGGRSLKSTSTTLQNEPPVHDLQM